MLERYHSKTSNIFASSIAVAGVAFAGWGGVLALAAPAAAQAPVAAIEGPIEAFNPLNNQVTVAGVLVQLRNFGTGQPTVITSPTTTRTGATTLEDWFNGPVLPGRVAPGFIGGTAKGEGIVNPVGQFVMRTLLTEPAENGLIGLVTANACTSANCQAPGDFLRVMGVAAIPIRDTAVPARIVAGPPVNAFGFEVDLAGRDLSGTPIAIEGYYGSVAGFPEALPTEKAFHYFMVELEDESAALLANKTVPEVNATRARCTPGGRLEVRGATHVAVQGANNAPIGNPAAGFIRARVSGAGGALLGETDELEAIPAPGGAVFANWRLRVDIAGACPAEINVFWRQGATIRARHNRVAVDSRPE